MSLFRYGEGLMQLHSGGGSRFLIDCDQLTEDDLQSLAEFYINYVLAMPRTLDFDYAVGIPEGGLRFAAVINAVWENRAPADRRNRDAPFRLVVDDVLTTGASMIAGLSPYEGARGLVIFDRSVDFPRPLVQHCTALFRLGGMGPIWKAEHE